MSEPIRLWESFWVDAGPHGCTELFPPQAQQAIADGWRTWFASFDRPSSLLDIATGRGAVLDHAAAILADRDSRLVGVDLADAATAERPEFTIKGGIDAAALPFDDRSFDHVSSQFGIEYAGFEPVIDEAARVCTTSMKMLIHASEGVVVRQNLLQAEQVRWMIDDLGLAKAFDAPGNGDPVERLLVALRERGERDENVSMLEAVYAALLQARSIAQGGDPATARRGLAALAAQLGEHGRRMHLLGGAGIDRARLDQAAESLRSRAFDARTAELRVGEHDHLVGYWLDARRTQSEGQ